MDRQNKRRLFQLIGMAVIAVVIFFIHAWYSNRYPSTDNAYVQADTVQVAPRVAGSVERVFVKNHDFVKKGQELFALDPKPFELKLKAAEAERQLASENFKRTEELLSQKFKTQSDLDSARSALAVAEVNVSQARLDLDYALVRSPADGQVIDLSMRPGDFLSAGESEFVIVENSWWVDANFKETHLERIQPQQPVTVVLDMYSGHQFKGTVESISPGTGAVFSLLPPENATGNWIKVVQRVPVKIHIENDPNFPLRVGVSAEATVDTASYRKS